VRKSVIVLEFNELSPSLMDKFIGQGRLPNFARLRDQSAVYTTDAEEAAPNLEPWIQWVTVHTGLGFEQHGVFELDRGVDLNAPRIWDLVSAAGGSAFVCGSMNPGYLPGLRGAIVPDPWSTRAAPYPERTFDTYYDYVRRNVQEHSREKSPVSPQDHLKFLAFMLNHGLSWKTISRTVSQLASERGGKFRWRRATILDRLQWDVFSHYWRRHRPTYATFFLNSTAHFQHYYWRNLQPELFALKPAAGEQAEYENAVLFGYQSMDQLAGECLQMAGPDTAIVLCSALSQQPCVAWEEKGGKVSYRPHDFDALLRWAGVSGAWRSAPIMSEQFHLYFSDAASAADAARKLESIEVGEINGEKAMLARCEGNQIYAGCKLFHQVNESDRIVCRETGAEARFFDLFYRISGMKSGMHHPDGILWISQSAKEARKPGGRISLRRVMPMLLDLVGVPVPVESTEVPASRS